MIALSLLGFEADSTVAPGILCSDPLRSSGVKKKSAYAAEDSAIGERTATEESNCSTIH